MELEEQWEKAIGSTEVLRSRVRHLDSQDNTDVPYVFLAESLVNQGNTVVRSGKVLMHKPAIILPNNLPQFEGFESEDNPGMDTDSLGAFFLVRGISFPSLKFRHETSSVEVCEDPLQKAIRNYKDRLEQSEDTQTGLIMGSADTWQFSVIIYAGMLAAKSAVSDMRWFEDKFKKWLT